MKHFKKNQNPFLEFVRCNQQVPVVRMPNKSEEMPAATPSVNVVKQAPAPEEVVVVRYVKPAAVDVVVVVRAEPQQVVDPPKTHLNPIFSSIIKQLRDEIRQQRTMATGGGLNIFPLPHMEELPPVLMSGAAVAGEIPLENNGVNPSTEEAFLQTGKVLSERPTDPSLVSSLSLLVSKTFSIVGEGLNFLHTLSGHMQLQASAQGLASAEGLQHNQLSAQPGLREAYLSNLGSFAETVVHQASAALSLGASNITHLNTAQVFMIALAHSLNLSSEETAKLLGKLQSPEIPHRSGLELETSEHFRLMNPFIQGMVLNDPSAMKGFLTQLFSPVLKSLMGLLFTKELPLSYFPSNLLAELGGLMARSAQRKRNRTQRRRVGKSDRVSRKGSIYVEVDLEDEGFEPEEETDWWERFYAPEETTAFLWN